MKEKISLYLVATVKRIGALWVGFLISMIPVYILRGNIHDLDTLAVAERCTTTAIVLLISAVLLFFLYRRDDHAAKLNTKETLLLVLIPTLIHFVFCFITAFTKNLIVISTGMGYYFVHLLEPEASSVAELSAGVQILAAAVVPILPAVGVFFGCLSARKKREKEVSELKREGELRR
jgi:hypothetical protein